MMLPSAPSISFGFAAGPQILFGPGTLFQLPQRVQGWNGTVLLVTGGVPGALPTPAARALELLNDSGRTVTVRSQHGEPLAATVDLWVSELRDQGIGLVIAIGGGSVLDMGKAMAGMLPHSNSVLDHLELPGGDRPHPGTRLPLVAIPTTAGSGSEASANAVLSGPGFKKSLRHPCLVPDLAMVDPELHLTLSPAQTAANGLDAFTQLLEPFLSPLANPITDSLAWSGLWSLVPQLERACGEGSQDLSVRSAMAYGSLMSGICLANAGLGTVHGIAGLLGGLYPSAPHGALCGTLVGAVLRANIVALTEKSDQSPALTRLALVGKLFRPEATDDRAAREALMAGVDGWIERLAMPRLREWGIPNEKLAELATEVSNRNNPVRLSAETIEAVLQERW